MFQENSEPQQCCQCRDAPSSSHSLNQPGQTTHILRFVKIHKADPVLGLPCKNPSCTVPSSEQIPDFKLIADKLIDPIQAKDWHTSVPMELRNHLVQKIVQALISNPDPSTLSDNRMVTLIEYACNGEGNIYQEADSRDEYYQLLGEEIYKIQKK